MKTNEMRQRGNSISLGAGAYLEYLHGVGAACTSKRTGDNDDGVLWFDNALVANRLDRGVQAKVHVLGPVLEAFT